MLKTGAENRVPMMLHKCIRTDLDKCGTCGRCCSSFREKWLHCLRSQKHFSYAAFDVILLSQSFLTSYYCCLRPALETSRRRGLKATSAIAHCACSRCSGTAVVAHTSGCKTTCGVSYFVPQNTAYTAYTMFVYDHMCLSRLVVTTLSELTCMLVTSIALCWRASRCAMRIRWCPVVWMTPMIFLGLTSDVDFALKSAR
jgi:hypothetical protein